MSTALSSSFGNPETREYNVNTISEKKWNNRRDAFMQYCFSTHSILF